MSKQFINGSNYLRPPFNKKTEIISIFSFHCRQDHSLNIYF